MSDYDSWLEDKFEHERDDRLAREANEKLETKPVLSLVPSLSKSTTNHPPKFMKWHDPMNKKDRS